MDISSVQASGKSASSDFSIKRILSNDVVNNKAENLEVPNWLCCTRYQPPRLPRSANNGYRARRSGRHARVPFTVAQAAALEAAYARAPYLAPPALRALAAALQLRDDRIKIWFQNRRARERREKSVKVIPPHEVTLPATTVIHHQPLLPDGSQWFPHPITELRNNPITVSSLIHNNITYSRDVKDSSRDLTTSTITTPTTSPRSNSIDSEENRLLDIETVED